MEHLVLMVRGVVLLVSLIFWGVVLLISLLICLCIFSLSLLPPPPCDLLLLLNWRGWDPWLVWGWGWCRCGWQTGG